MVARRRLSLRTTVPTLLPIHIGAGALAIVFGAVALAVRKGGSIHRRIGLAFVYAMPAMAISGAVMAFQRSPSDGNVNALAIIGAVRMYIGGVIALGTPRGTLNGVPYFMLFFLGTVLALSAAGDVRVIRTGPLHGRQRLSRHLWRMCFALFIAVGSFFTIQSRVATILPEAFAASMFRMLPIPLVFAAMFYWLWRIRARAIPQRS